jgi:small conductance mechanosensitive channel
MKDTLFTWGTHILFALAIFFIGRIVARYAIKFLRSLLRRASLDEILVNFIGSLCHVALLIFVIIAALHELGIDTTSLIAILGAAGLAVGLALKNSLQNFASGVLLILFRPFKIDDFVETAGITGIIEDVNIFNTVLKTLDNRRITIPNSMIYNDKIINYSAKDIRRIDMIFPISYEDDLEAAKKIVWDLIREDSRILEDPEPFVGVGEWTENGISLYVRPWVKKEDFWVTKTNFLEKVKLAFDKVGMTIPYQKMQVYLKEGKKSRK